MNKFKLNMQTNFYKYGEKLFKVLVIFKLLYSLGEFILGIGLLFVNEELYTKFIIWFTSGELREDKADLLMNFLLNATKHFSIETSLFLAWYFIMHALLKIIVLFLLYKKKILAFPLSILLFIWFIYIEVEKYLVDHSPLMMFLIILDVFVILLTIVEWKNVIKRRNDKNS